MQQSEHYNMNLPEGPDYYNVEDFNSNTRVIDEKMYEFENHTQNTNNPHGVTKTQLGLENVENKSSAMIRGELTSADVENALGYTAMNIDGSNAAEEVVFSGAFTVGSRDRSEGMSVGTISVAEGNNNKATAMYSHAEGDGTWARSRCSHTEGTGCETQSDGYANSAHAEGHYTYADGQAAHAEGMYTKATFAAHAEGRGMNSNNSLRTIQASGYGSHAEGYTNSDLPNAYKSYIKATANGSHAEGYVDILNTTHDANKIASGVGSHAEGAVEGGTIQASGHGAHAEGHTYGDGAIIIASGNGAHAEGAADGGTITASGGTITASGKGSHAEGYAPVDNEIIASGDGAHAEGCGTRAYAECSHAEGSVTVASSGASHAEGIHTYVSNQGGHAEGFYANVYGTYSGHAEGYHTSSTGGYGAHAEGNYTTASGGSSHAEGDYTFASGYASHAEGHGFNGSGNPARIIASGSGSHAEGLASSRDMTASGDGSHAEGKETTAAGNYSHAEGRETIAQYECQHVGGKYNSNKSTTLFEVGNGTSDSARSNAFEVYADGYISQNDGVDKYKFAKVNGHDGYYDTNGAFHNFGEGGGGTGDGMATDGSNADPDIAFPSQTVSFGFDRDEWFSGTVFNLSKPAGENQTVTFTTNLVTSEAVYRIMHSFKALLPIPSIMSDYPLPKLKVQINDEDRFLSLVSMEEVDYLADRFTAVFENDTEEQIELDECDFYYPAYDEFVDSQFSRGTSYSYAPGFVFAHGFSFGSLNMTADGGVAIGEGCAASRNGIATGLGTFAGGGCHTEGEGCSAYGGASHAEGYYTTSIGFYSHAEGQETVAREQGSHAEGTSTEALGFASHAEGDNSIASGDCSHAGGRNATAPRDNQFVQGGNGYKLDSLFSCDAMAASGFQPDATCYSENTEITDGQCGCGGCISQNVTMTIDLEPLGMYSLYCSSFESDGSVHGSVYGMITATGNGGSPTWLPISQTNTDAVQIQMLANDKISIQNTQTGAQFHLIRIM